MKTHFLFLILLLPGMATAQSDTQHQKDSLRHVIATSDSVIKLNAYLVLTNIYFMESASDDLKMDTLLALYREYDAEAVRLGRYKSQGIIRANRLAAYRNRKEFDKVIRQAPEDLAYLFEYDVRLEYYNIYQTYLRTFLDLGEYDRAIEGAHRMYGEAQQSEYDNGRGMALYILTVAYGEMNRYEEEEQYARECIDIIKDMDGMLGVTAQVYSRLCNALIIMKRYEEALLQAQEYEKLNYRYDEVSKTKQTISWINLWNVYMRLYVGLAEYDKAEIYGNKIDGEGKTPIVLNDFYSMRSHIYYHRQEYDKALEMADKAFEEIDGNPQQEASNMMLKLMILCAMRDADDIYELFQQTASLRDSIRSNEFNARLDELRTVYEVDKINAEKVRIRNNFLFASGGCILLAIVLGIWILYSRAIVLKNRGLYRQIKEQDFLKQELEAMKKQISKAVETGESGEAGGGEAVKKTPGNLQQRKLVERLHEYLLLNKNYTNPDIERGDLVAELITNKTYLFDAVKAVTGKSLLEYINVFRLEEARRMFDNHSELNIEVISENCGFSSYLAFYRAFRDYYKMSPAAYRKMAKMNNE